MNKKLGLHIGGRRFDVDVEEKFSVFLREKMAQDFNMDGNNDLKTLLQAYVRKSHELYIQNQKIDEMLDKLKI